MNQPSLKKINDHQYELSGELSMQNVPQVAEASAAMIHAMRGEISIDLSKVSRADSAGLVLLIEWLRIARRNNFTLRFEQLPEQLMQIARVSELHSILPINS